MTDLVLDEDRPAMAPVLDRGVVCLDGRRAVVVPVPVEGLRSPARTQSQSTSNTGNEDATATMTYERRDRDAVGRAAVQVLVVVDAGDANDRVHKVRHLRAPVHEVRVRDLDGASGAVVGRDGLGTLGGLLGIGRGERLGLCTHCQRPT